MIWAIREDHTPAFLAMPTQVVVVPILPVGVLVEKISEGPGFWFNYRVLSGTYADGTFSADSWSFPAKLREVSPLAALAGQAE